MKSIENLTLKQRLRRPYVIRVEAREKKIKKKKNHNESSKRLNEHYASWNQIVRAMNKKILIINTYNFFRDRQIKS